LKKHIKTFPISIKKATFVKRVAEKFNEGPGNIINKHFNSKNKKSTLYDAAFLSRLAENFANLEQWIKEKQEEISKQI